MSYTCIRILHICVVLLLLCGVTAVQSILVTTNKYTHYNYITNNTTYNNITTNHNSTILPTQFNKTQLNVTSDNIINTVNNNDNTTSNTANNSTSDSTNNDNNVIKFNGTVLIGTVLIQSTMIAWYIYHKLSYDISTYIFIWLVPVIILLIYHRHLPVVILWCVCSILIFHLLSLSFKRPLNSDTPGIIYTTLYNICCGIELMFCIGIFIIFLVSMSMNDDGTVGEHHDSPKPFYLLISYIIYLGM